MKYGRFGLCYWMISDKKIGKSFFDLNSFNSLKYVLRDFLSFDFFLEQFSGKIGKKKFFAIAAFPNRSPLGDLSLHRRPFPKIGLLLVSFSAKSLPFLVFWLILFQCDIFNQIQSKQHEVAILVHFITIKFQNFIQPWSSYECNIKKIYHVSEENLENQIFSRPMVYRFWKAWKNKPDC